MLSPKLATATPQLNHSSVHVTEATSTNVHGNVTARTACISRSLCTAQTLPTPTSGVLMPEKVDPSKCPHKGGDRSQVEQYVIGKELVTCSIRICKICNKTLKRVITKREKIDN